MPSPLAMGAQRDEVWPLRFEIHVDASSLEGRLPACLFLPLVRPLRWRHEGRQVAGGDARGERIERNGSLCRGQADGERGRSSGGWPRLSMRTK